MLNLALLRQSDKAGIYASICEFLDNNFQNLDNPDVFMPSGDGCINTEMDDNGTFWASADDLDFSWAYYVQVQSDSMLSEHTAVTLGVGISDSLELVLDIDGVEHCIEDESEWNEVRMHMMEMNPDFEIPATNENFDEDVTNWMDVLD